MYVFYHKLSQRRIIKSTPVTSLKVTPKVKNVNTVDFWFPRLPASLWRFHSGRECLKNAGSVYSLNQSQQISAHTTKNFNILHKYKILGRFLMLCPDRAACFSRAIIKSLLLCSQGSSVDRSVGQWSGHSGSKWNMSTVFTWIAMKYCADIHVSQRKKLTDFAWNTTRRLIFVVFSDISLQLLDRLHDSHTVQSLWRSLDFSFRANIWTKHFISAVIWFKTKHHQIINYNISHSRTLC